MLICLADMPFVGPRQLRALLVHRLDPAEGATAAGSRMAGSATIGPPAAFAAQWSTGSSPSTATAERRPC